MIWKNVERKCRAKAEQYKSEADKVIAKLKDKVREQTSIAEEGWKEAGTYHTSYAESVKELYEKNKELRHHKYKRCLDKVKWCEERISRYTLQQEIQGISWQKEIKFYRRLQNKFIEISKQFKEV